MSKKINWKKILRYLWIAYAFASIVLVLYLVDSLVSKDIKDVSNRVIIDGNWKIDYNGKVYDNVSLEDFKIDSVKRNDVIIMETTVPSDFDYSQSTLCIKNKHTTLNMYVDDKLVYEYGQERFAENKATGSGYLFINFDKEYKGKELRLEYTVTEDGAFSKFDQVRISEWQNAKRYIITTNRLPLLMGCFLIVFGVVMALVLIFTMVYSTKYTNALLLSVFSICIGIWTMCYYGIMIIFAIPLYKVSLMEQMALFIAPLPLVGYMHSYIKEARSKHVTIIYNVLFWGQLALTITAIALHTTNTIHGVRLIKYFQMMIVLHLAFLVYALYVRAKNNTKISRFTTVGMIMVAVCVFYELITHILPRHADVKLMEIKGIASVGFIIFLGVLVMDLYRKVTQNMMEEQEKELLIKRAYTDDLTKLHNRAYCSEYMRDLSVNKNTPYTIINFDLNGLKQMNDTYGHIKGDELICYAAIVLEKTFSSEGVVGRMGGDEFIAILETDNTEFIDGLLEKLNDNIKAVNEKKPDLGLSISYGYATSTEVEGGSDEKVYLIADERMYAYKQKVKRELGQ